MKKILIIIPLIFATSAFSKLKVVVSIQPEVEFVKKIGGDRVDVSLMVEAGASPHTYEPKPSQMRAINSANLYLAIGVEFEKSWLDRFKSQNSNLKVIDISKDIEKIDNNPHTWTAPKNIKVIAQNIFLALSDNDSNQTKYYRENLKKFIKDIEETDRKIREILKDIPKGSIFMDFHPAWGYFAREYGLKELSIEVNGKEPKPREIIEIIKKAKREEVKAIFTQPEFSDKSAQIIANTLKIEVIKTSPLAKNWNKNLIGLAEAIADRKLR